MIHEDLIISVTFPTPEAIEMQKLPNIKQCVKNITRDDNTDTFKIMSLM